MPKKKLILAFFFFAFFFFPLFTYAAVVGREVEYKQGDALLQGYLAYEDSAKEKRPGVIIVHEWKGLNEYAKSRARQLAELGYVALAADIYGKGIRPESHEEAAKVSDAYRSDRNLTRARGKAALDFLRSQDGVDRNKIAAIGYCFGGMTALEMARAGFDLKGAASFHGFLATPAPAGPNDIKAKIVVFHGKEDKFIPEEEVKAFKEEMARAKADFQFIVLEGAVHSFTVPQAGGDKSTGMAYNEEADKRSWAMLLDFFDKIFA